MKNLSADFPLLSQYTYVNTPASGILSEDLMDWRQEHDIDFLIGGSMFREQHPKVLQDTRKALAKLFNASPDNTILVPNFSIGFSTLVSTFGAPKKILLLEDEYPSVVWPFLTENHELHTLPVTHDMEAQIAQALKTLKPDVFAFSIVQYISGIKIELEAIKQLKEAFPEVFFVADGTQFCGTEPFDFSASGIDVLGSSGYKWMLAGYGNGFMFFQKGLEDRLFTNTLAHEPRKEDFLKDKKHLSNHFEQGHLDSLTFGSLGFAAQYLQKIGMEHIGAVTAELSAYAKEKFAALGFLEETVVKRQGHSAIFSLSGGQKLLDTLRSKDILASIRGGRVRVGFHFYNTKKDVDKVVSVLRNFKN